MPDRVEIDGHILIHGDCLEDVLPTLADKSIDCVVTSPPYNLNKAYSGGGLTKICQTMTAKYAEWYDDDMDEAEYQQWQRQVVDELVRVCDGSVFYNHRIRYAWHNRNKNAPPCKIFHPMQWLGSFPIWSVITWDRCGGSHPNGRFLQADEHIYQIGKPKAWHETGHTSVWRFPPSKDGDSHPCAFPVELPRRCILSSTNVGDIVLDPFSGSGTTGLACIKTGRKYIGVEKDREYFEMSVKRLKEAVGVGSLFDIPDEPCLFQETE